ncbi:MAG: P-loop NTPase fold protein [Anaerolineales bacterium]
MSVTQPPAEMQKIFEQLEAVLFVEQEWSFADNLFLLSQQIPEEAIPRLPHELLERLLSRSFDLGEAHDRKQSLRALAPLLPEDLVTEAFKRALEFSADDDRADAIGVIGPYLPDDLRDKAIKEITAIPEATIRLKAWTGLVAYLPLELRDEAVTTAIEAVSGPDQVEALIGLAPHLPDPLNLRVLESARSIYPPSESVRVLATLVPGLPGEARGKALNEALEIARNATDVFERTGAFIYLLPVLPDPSQREVRDQALESARMIEDARERSWKLEQLAAFFPDPDRMSIYQESLDSVFQFVEAEDLVEEVARMAVSFPPEMLGHLLEAVEKIEDSNLQVRVFNRIDGLLPENVRLHPDALAGEKVAAEEEEADLKAEIPAVESAEEEIPDSQQEDLKKEREAPATAEKARVPGSEQEKVSAEELSGEGRPVSAFLHSDKWTLNDQLNYSIYAKALAEFIVHPDTDPPLTVGILAPWGHGKTTLMRLVQYQIWLRTLNDKLNSAATREGTLQFVQDRGMKMEEGEVVDTDKAKQAFLLSRRQGPLDRPATTFSKLENWLDELSPRVETQQTGGTEPAPKIASILQVDKLDYPTVWFNAWKYQTSEQVWAGLAHAIISQLVEQIPSAMAREKFWLALQFERLDVNAIRQDIHKAILERFLPGIFLWAVVTVIGILLTAVGTILTTLVQSPLVMAIPGAGILTTLAGVIPVIVKWLSSKSKVEEAPLEGKFAQYVRQPSYEAKAGFFQEVEQDIRRVFDLLVTPGKPAVVFIDDLDRCSPGKVAEVIEAVNLFLSGDFPNCYFVLGADAQVVAASLEMAYEELTNRLANVTRNYGSLGWYFMDKFIQLQFIIPNITPQQRTKFLGELFNQPVDEEGGAEEPASAEEAERQVQEAMKKEADFEEIAQEAAPALKVIRRQRPEQFNRIGQQFVSLQAKHFKDNDPDILEYLKRYERFLGTSPRTMKRFANQYRFYGLVQSSRRILELPSAPPSSLPQWLVVMLRWPQLVRWIQWEGEMRLTGGGTNPLERAKRISDEILAAKEYDVWLVKLKDFGAEGVDWLVDRQLYEFFHDESDRRRPLTFPVEVGIW